MLDHYLRLKILWPIRSIMAVAPGSNIVPKINLATGKGKNRLKVLEMTLYGS
jgi:hypothetical protein